MKTNKSQPVRRHHVVNAKKGYITSTGGRNRKKAELKTIIAS